MERPSISITNSTTLVHSSTTLATNAPTLKPGVCCGSPVIVSPTFLPCDENTGQLNCFCSQVLVTPPFLPFEFNTNWACNGPSTTVELVELVELLELLEFVELVELDRS
jgi:hypothetical protein